MATQDNTRTRDYRARRLERACEHVGDLWFPVSADLLHTIQNALGRGDYAQDVSSLVDIVRGDYALFAYCLRQLLLMLSDEEGVEVPRGLNPIELMRWSGIERLSEILSVEPGSITRHSLSRPGALQLARFQEALISASTSEVLAQSYELDPELAFSAALLRQLGYTLIAWNYPEVYAAATQAISATQTLDQAISAKLGFSPLLLGATLIRRWDTKQQFKLAALCPFEAQEIGMEEHEESAVMEQLIHICKVGEALARANNPAIYPTAQHDWESALGEIEARVGPDGLKRIGERFKENTMSYVTLVPQVFRPALVLDPQAKLASEREAEALSRNPWVHKCRDFLKVRLAGLYARISPGRVDSQDLEYLREIIPLAGFVGGCVYTMDPGIVALTPRMALGKTAISAFRPIVDPSAKTSEEVVAAAFDTGNLQTAIRKNGDDITSVSIAAPIGVSNRVGAMMLTLPGALFDEDRAQHLIHMRAITQALNDCLGLE
jgi:hypothetical protein